MATSKGVRLCLLAARGLLKCPDEHKYLLYLLMDKGVDIEVKKELIYFNLNRATNKERYDEYNQSLYKLLFPDVEDPVKKIFEEAAKQIGKPGEKVRIKADKTNPLKQLGNFKVDPHGLRS